MKIQRSKEIREEMKFYSEDDPSIPMGSIETSSKNETLTITVADGDGGFWTLTLNPYEALDVSEFIHNWADEQVTKLSAKSG